MELSYCLIVFTLVFPSGYSSSASQHESEIDLNHLLVIADQFSQSQSLFGFSHVLVEGNDGQGWIIIGAPKSESSDRDYKLVQQPGVLWRCSLHGNSNNTDTCRILFVDPLNSRLGKGDCKPNACPNERHDNAGLGSTLVINQERLVVCAPKWQRQVGNGTDSFKTNGMCYWLPINVLLSQPFNMSSMVSSGYRSQRLFPLMDKNWQIRGNYPLWAWGQAGFSAYLTESNELYLGAPGVNGWNGTVVKYQDSKDGNALMRPRMNNKNGTQSEFSQYMVLQTQFVQLYHHLEYFGYAVSSGKYFQSGQEDAEDAREFVSSSAPRGGRMHGLVLIFEFPTQEPILWLPILALQGTQFGSQFGSTLYSIDMNGDGFDELLVGAPFQQTEVATSGCVFVYTSLKEKYKFSVPMLLCDAESGGAAFGSAISTLGDVNNDGFQDVAIGAPYEGQGAVFIYYGKSTFGFEPVRYSIKITPEGINQGYLSGFGFSIFGGVNIDDNQSPDFAVSAPFSQNVVIFRTRQVVDFDGHIDFYVNAGSSSSTVQVLHTDVARFVVRSCVRISKSRLRKDTEIEVQIKLTVDVEYERFKIIKSTLPIAFEQLSNSSVLYKTKLHSKGTPDCVDWISTHNSNYKLEISPKPMRIVQRLLYFDAAIHDTKSARIHTIWKTNNGVPELVITGQEYDAFCKFCPPTTRVTTEIQIPIAVDNCNDDGNPMCSPHLQMEMHFEIDNVIYGSGDSLVIGTVYELTIEIQVLNLRDGETAYFPYVELRWNETLFIPTRDGLCDFNETEMSIKCGLGDIIQPGGMKFARIGLSLDEVYARRLFEEVTFEASAHSVLDSSSLAHANQTQTFSPESTSSLKVILEAEVEMEFLGSIENATFANDGLLTPIVQTYSVLLTGSSPAQSLRFSFWFPVRHGRDEDLVLIGQPKENACAIRNGTFYNHHSDNKSRLGQREIFEPFSHYSSNQPNRNGKEWVLPSSWDSHSELPEPNQKNSFTELSQESRHFVDKFSTQLRCTNENDGSCVQVDCQMNRIAPNHKILIKFPLFVQNHIARRLLAKTSKVLGLLIQSLGRAVLFGEEPKMASFVTIVSNDRIQLQHATIDIVWIYIISVVIGIAILLLLIYILIKCDFFKREERYPPWKQLRPADQECVGAI